MKTTFKGYISSTYADIFVKEIKKHKRKVRSGGINSETVKVKVEFETLKKRLKP